MEIQCPKCAAEQDAKDPFCLECGEVFPSVISRGRFIVRIDDVPSSQIRDKVVKTLQEWFPSISYLDSEKRLARKGAIIASGLEEASARRVLDALGTMKVHGKIERIEQESGVWPKLLNWGLGISAFSLILALLSGGLFGLFLFAVALGAPFLVAFSSKPETPLASLLDVDRDDNRWVEVAQLYGSKLGELDPRAREGLKDFVRHIFALKRILSTDTVASHAAGGTKGPLYEKLPHAIETGISVSASMVGKDDETRMEMNQELSDLTESARRALDSLRELDRDGGKKAKDLAREIDSTASRVDTILREIRNEGAHQSSKIAE